MFIENGMDLDETEIAELIAEADANNDGVIGFEGNSCQY